MKIDPFLFGTQRCKVDVKADKDQMRRLLTALYWPHTVKSLVEFVVGRKEHSVDLEKLAPSLTMMALLHVNQLLGERIRAEDHLYGFPMERTGSDMPIITIEKTAEPRRGLF